MQMIDPPCDSAGRDLCYCALQYCAASRRKSCGAAVRRDLMIIIIKKIAGRRFRPNLGAPDFSNYQIIIDHEKYYHIAAKVWLVGTLKIFS